MKQIDVIYHHEGQTWWAESAHLPGFSAAASSFSELHTLVSEGIDFYLDGAPHAIRESLDDGALISPSTQWYSSSIASAVSEAALPSGPQGLVVGRELVAA